MRASKMTTDNNPEPAEGTVGSGGKFEPAPEQVPEQPPKSPKASKSTETKKSNEEVAKEVLAGRWSRGQARKKKLEDAGYNVNDINAEINKLLNQR
jgi:hypothetical protein